MRASPGGGLPFLPLDLGVPRRSAAARRTGVPIRAATPTHPPKIEAVESEGDVYTATNWYDACFRVLKHNEGRTEDAKNFRKRWDTFSVLGLYGHVERANAWIHVFGGILFLLFAVLRGPAGLDVSSVPGMLSTATSVVVAVTFAVSTAFHTLGTVRWLAPVMRALDHTSIDVALAVACTTDASVVTMGFDDVPWQTVADAIGVASVIMSFFLYRRAVLPPEETEIVWGSCALGLFRVQHGDFEFGALRSASYVVLSFSFLLLVPSALRNLTAPAALTLLACNAVSLACLVGGLVLDNVFIEPDMSFVRRIDKPRASDPPWLKLQYSRDCGCVMTSHAWWHAWTLVSVITLTAGREVAIATM